MVCSGALVHNHSGSPFGSKQLGSISRWNTWFWIGSLKQLLIENACSYGLAFVCRGIGVRRLAVFLTDFFWFAARSGVHCAIFATTSDSLPYFFLLLLFFFFIFLFCLFIENCLSWLHGRVEAENCVANESNSHTLFVCVLNAVCVCVCACEQERERERVAR